MAVYCYPLKAAPTLQRPSPLGRYRHSARVSMDIHGLGVVREQLAAGR